MDLKSHSLMAGSPKKESHVDLAIRPANSRHGPRPMRRLRMRKGADRAYHEIALAGPSVIGSGWAALTKTSTSGKRQIIAIFIPGDQIGFPDQMALPSHVDITALSTVDFYSAETSRSATRPPLSALLLNQIFRADLDGPERLVHLFLELHERLQAAGLAPETFFNTPLTQEQISATVGMSPVHVSRILTKLKADGLISLQDRKLCLLNRDRLLEMCEYKSFFATQRHCAVGKKA